MLLSFVLFSSPLFLGDLRKANIASQNSTCSFISLPDLDKNEIK